MKTRLALGAAAFTCAATLIAPSVLGGQSIGPDVICGDVNGIVKWGTVGSQSAYSIGTTSCNMGNQNLLWQQTTTNHPVISQKVYRLKDGEFELLGVGWLKHSFCALQQFLCSAGCSGQGGCLSVLTPLCSDPYTPQRNGQQNLLGPRWQVNATTGVFPYPPDAGMGIWNGTLARRIILENADIDPAQNPGAIYIMETGYTTKDDTDAGNQFNNMSHRRVTFSAAPALTPIPSGATTREETALKAWQNIDPTVVIEDFFDGANGLFHLGYKVSELEGGQWHYEYVLYNYNSDRAAREFIVPIGSGVTLSNVEFHDITYHSGDGIGGVNQDGTDWTFAEGGGDASWSTVTLAQNPNGNALRWGAAYTFRFDADAPPTDVDATVGLFKFGSPQSVNVPTMAPGAGTPCDADLDGSGDVGFSDLLILLAAWTHVGVPADLDGGGVGFSDLLILLSAWGPC